MKKHWKRITSLILAATVVLTIAGTVNPLEAEAAASTGYFPNHYALNMLPVNKDAYIQEGFALHGNKAYCFQKNSADTKNIITVTDMTTKKTTIMKDSATGKTTLTYLGHANDATDLKIGGKTNVFVTTMNANDHGLVRFVMDGNTFTKMGNYKFKYKGATTYMSSLEVVSTTSKTINFLFKRGTTFYTGSLPLNSKSGTIEVVKAFTINVKAINIKGKDCDYSSFSQQGFCYKDNTVFVPMSKGNVSVVAVYNIMNPKDNLKSNPALSFRVTSGEYPYLFEIESCDIGSNGKLYFNTNRLKAEGGASGNALHEFQNYKYSPLAHNTVTAAHKEKLKNLLFDATIYANAHSDLQRAFGNNTAKLKNHWLTCGIKEGRLASAFFDAKYYLKKYPDVARAFGKNNYAAAYDHFVDWGFWEGRQGSQYFLARVYLDNNTDVAHAFGGLNLLGAAQHYTDCGLNEMQRVGSDDYSQKAYYNRYGDLRAAFGKNGRRLIVHYHTAGKTEGRNCL